MIYESMAYHELKHSIERVLINTARLKQLAIEEPKAKRSIDELGYAVEELKNVLDFLWEYRLSPASLVFEPVRLLELVTHAVNQIEPAARRQRIRIDVDLRHTDRSAEIYANKNLLRLAFLNLLDNAIRYSYRTTSRNSRRFITVSGSERNDGYEIVFGNYGEELSPDVLTMLNATLEHGAEIESRLNSASGIGLAIVRYVVDIHGGTVGVSSRSVGSAEGVTSSSPHLTHFSIWLPYARSNELGHQGERTSASRQAYGVYPRQQALSEPMERPSAFTVALYYPSIDINDDVWLKNALLYWDRIYTIAPVSIEEPYSSEVARECRDSEVLVPLPVSPQMREVQDLADDILDYLSSREASELLIPGATEFPQYIHTEKLPDLLRLITMTHPSTLPRDIRRLIREGCLLIPEGNEWYRSNPGFSNYYMTLLAVRLSEQIGAGLLTNSPGSNQIALSAKLDSSVRNPIGNLQPLNPIELLGRRSISAPTTLAQGMLASFIIEQVQVAHDTSIDRLLTFKREHSEELGAFRTAIHTLTRSITNDLPFELLYQQIQDIYSNDVESSMQRFKESLTESGIRWATENFLKIAFLSTSTTSVLSAVGLSVPQALLAGTGISLTASGILYSLERREALRNDPYTYVFSMRDSFGTH